MRGLVETNSITGDSNVRTFKDVNGEHSSVTAQKNIGHLHGVIAREISSTVGPNWVLVGGIEIWSIPILCNQSGAGRTGQTKLQSGSLADGLVIAEHRLRKGSHKHLRCPTDLTRSFRHSKSIITGL